MIGKFPRITQASHPEKLPMLSYQKIVTQTVMIQMIWNQRIHLQNLQRNTEKNEDADGEDDITLIELFKRLKQRDSIESDVEDTSDIDSMNRNIQSFKYLRYRMMQCLSMKLIVSQNDLKYVEVIRLNYCCGL